MCELCSPEPKLGPESNRDHNRRARTEAEAVSTVHNLIAYVTK